MYLARGPLAGGLDCPAELPPAPIVPDDPFAWGVHEAGGLVSVAWGRLDPREGGLQVVVFAADAPGGGDALVAAIGEVGGRVSQLVIKAKCGMLGVEPFALLLPLQWLRRAGRRARASTSMA